MTAPSILLLLSTSVLATEVNLDLTILPNSRTNLTYRVGTQLTGTHFTTNFQDRHQASVDYTGNILARATVNASNGSLETIEFTGGQIMTEDTMGFLSVFVGITPYSIIFSTRDITRTTSSSQIDVLANGFVNGAIHFTTLTGGILEVSNFNTGVPTPTVTETFDFANDTNDLIANESLFPNQTGATTIGSSFESNSLFGKNYSVQMVCVVSVPARSPDATIQAAGLGPLQQFQQRYFETGILSASGAFTLPNAFGQWVADNGLALTTGQEKNESGFPYALLFALGLPADAIGLPIEFSNTDPVTARLTPPAGGLGLNLGVEYSPDLATPFQALDPSLIPGGENQLAQGSSNAIDILLPSSPPQGFLRFFAQP